MEKYVSCGLAIIICTGSKLTCASVLFQKPDFSRFPENPVFDLIKLRNVAEWPQRLRPSIMLDCGPQGSEARTAHHTKPACTLAYACDQGIRMVCAGIIRIGLVFSELAQPCRQQSPEDAFRTRSAIQHSTTCMSWNLNSKIHIQLIIC